MPKTESEASDHYKRGLVVLVVLPTLFQRVASQTLVKVSDNQVKVINRSKDNSRINTCSLLQSFVSYCYKDGPMGREEVINGPPDRAGSSNETVPVPPHLVNATDDSESIVAREAPLACLSALMGNEDPTQMFVSNADLTSCVSSVYRPDPDTGMNSHKTSLQEIADCLNALFEC